MVDDQLAQVVPEIRRSIGELAGEGAGPTFLVNTHWHADHTGGNAAFGEEATILAHANVRRRLAGDPSMSGRVGENTPAAALPVVTFEESASLHFNGEEVRLFYLEAGHTDGDIVVWFTGSGVVHTGDLFVRNYPYVDLDSGGDVRGILRSVRRLLELLPEDTRVIPGHGAPADVATLREYADMLETMIGRVEEALAVGDDVDAMEAAGLTSDYDEVWGGSSFMPPRRFLELTARSLGRE